MSTQHDQEGEIKVGITMGDINGIGPEVIIKALSDNRMMQTCTPVIYGSAKTISFYRKLLGINEFNYNGIRSSGEILLRKINLINCWEEEAKVEPGVMNEVGGRYALKSLNAATKDLIDKKIDVLVTAPINKHNMQQDGFNFPGHTEYLAKNCNTENYLMMMVSDNLRVAVVTGHTPLKQVAQQLTKEAIVQKLLLMNESLKKDFGIRKPRITVMGLNPHAGDGGLLGKEEIEIITPAIKAATEKNVLAMGPYSTDGFFGSGAFRKFDGILAMYHDQGLIPFKTLSFSTGVDYTAGLPIIRTSPDHGTGFDIAGKNTAHEESIRQAIFLACDIFNKRQEYLQLNANPLAFSKKSGDR